MSLATRCCFFVFVVFVVFVWTSCNFGLAAAGACRFRRGLSAGVRHDDAAGAVVPTFFRVMLVAAANRGFSAGVRHTCCCCDGGSGGGWGAGDEEDNMSSQ